MFRTIYDTFIGIFARSNTPTSNLNNSVLINDEWVAMLSDCEERVAETQRTQLNHDLQTLKDRPRANYKNLYNDIDSIMFQYDTPDDALTPDMKMSIFKSIFTKMSPSWLDYLIQLSPKLITSWYPTEYERNILGELIAIATQFSPDKLNSKGLSQTLMSVHLSLVSSIGTLSYEQSNDILKMLISSANPIIELWILTVSRSKYSTNKMGKLPSRWKEKENGAKKHISAKYVEAEADLIRRKYLLERFGVDKVIEDNMEFKSCEISPHTPTREFLKTKKALEGILKFGIPERRITKKLSGELLENKRRLEIKLQFRVTNE